MDMKDLTGLTNYLRRLHKDPSYKLFQKSVNNTLRIISDTKVKDCIMYIMSDCEEDFNADRVLRYNYNNISGAARAYDISDNAIGFTVDYHECIFVAHPINSIFTKGDNYYLEI